MTGGIFIPIINMRRRIKEVIKLKVKVIRRFRDWEENLKTREVGEVFEANKDRVEELVSKGFVEAVPEVKKETKKAAD